MNTFELRKLLIEDLQQLRSNLISPNEARARAALARQILDSMKLEVISTMIEKPIQPLALTGTDEVNEPNETAPEVQPPPPQRTQRIKP